MTPETDAPMEMQEGAESFHDRVIHPWMFRAYMLAKMPVLGVTGTYLTDIDTEHCETVVPFGWGTKNLFGRFSDSAVVAAAETTSLALLVLHVRNQEAELTADLDSMSVDAGSPGENDLRVRCTEGVEAADFVYRADREPPRSREFHVKVERRSGGTVYEVELDWTLRRKD